MHHKENGRENHADIFGTVSWNLNWSSLIELEQSKLYLQVRLVAFIHSFISYSYIHVTNHPSNQPTNQPTNYPAHQHINPPTYQHSPSQLWCPVWKSSWMLPSLGSFSDLFPSPIPGREPLLIPFTAHVTLERADRLHVSPAGLSAIWIWRWVVCASLNFVQNCSKCIGRPEDFN